MTQPQAYPEGTTIKNPATGERMVMQGGKWISLGTPQMARTLPAQDASYVESSRNEAHVLRKITDLADQFGQLNQHSGTGGALEMGMPLLGTGIADVESTTNPNIKAMQALTKRMIPLQREKGAGPIRMQEIGGMGGGIFGGDIPRVENTGPANAIIRGQWHRQADMANDYVNHLDWWARQNGTINGADEAYEADVKAGRRPWQQSQKPAMTAPVKAVAPGTPVVPGRGQGFQVLEVK